MSDAPKHVVAVIGGAVAGSVAAQLLAAGGVEVVVFEQNDRPYGKIEDGLPRWHASQREQEYARIDERLDHPNIHFVPRTRLGEDLDFTELATEWGLSAVVLANGAWRDRPLPVDGAEGCAGKGLEDQNPFIYWFNHQHEPDYRGPVIELPDGAVVVGGGLASIDVVKACQLFHYGRALRERGHEVSLHDLEAKGVTAICDQLAVDPDALGIEGALLVYRRTAQDMPLAQPPADATAEQLEKTRGVRQKILDRAMQKYRFRFQDLTAPSALVTDAAGRVTGLRAHRTELVDGRVRTVEGSEHVLPTTLVISSIGSLLPTRSPLYHSPIVLDLYVWFYGDNEWSVFDRKAGQQTFQTKDQLNSNTRRIYSNAGPRYSGAQRQNLAWETSRRGECRATVSRDCAR